MTNLLHISYDLRQRNSIPVTTAVSNLIAETIKSADINIIDLVRVPYFGKEKINIEDKNHIKIDSFGLPYGIFITYSLKRAFNTISSLAEAGKIDLKQIDVIHAHKVTFEGYIAYLLSVKYDTKLIVTLRQTDAWVFRRRPDLIRYFKPVFERSSKIIYLTPYIIKLIKKYSGEKFFNHHIKNKLEFIPNIVERNFNPERKIIQKDYCLTALQMNKRSVWRKNLRRLFQAIKKLNNVDFKLVVLGDGNYLPKVKKWVNKLGIENNIIFKGNVSNSEMDKFYASSIAFLLPSLSESFGMVYAESLLNGTPIMYSKNRMGFDGIFENVGVGVDPSSVDSIAKGIEDLMRNNSQYKKNIYELQLQGEFKIFSSKHIRNKYVKILSSLDDEKRF